MSGRVNTARWSHAVREMQALRTSRTAEQIAESAVKGLIRGVVAITPPARGKANPEAKRRGEATVLSDLLKLAQPVTVAGRGGSEGLATADELLDVHRAARGRTGRTSAQGKKLFIAHRDFNRVLAVLVAQVGTLAAGWNHAAERFGIRLPPWITRHGNRHGIVQVVHSSTRLRITIGNKVPFADNVHDFQRRVNFALNQQAAALERGAREAIKRLAARGGFRVR